MRIITGGLASVALAAALLVAGGGQAQAQHCTIKVGAVLPVSGPMGLVGKRI